MLNAGIALLKRTSSKPLINFARGILFKGNGQKRAIVNGFCLNPKKNLLTQINISKFYNRPVIKGFTNSNEPVKWVPIPKTNGRVATTSYTTNRDAYRMQRHVVPNNNTEKVKIKGFSIENSRSSEIVADLEKIVQTSPLGRNTTTKSNERLVVQGFNRQSSDTIFKTIDPKSPRAVIQGYRHG